MIREAIEIFLGAVKGPQGPEEDPFEDVIGIARSGIKDGSQRHDDYLYGKKA